MFEQNVLQLQVNGKQYSINHAAAIQTSCGTIPEKWFENSDMPESAIKTGIVVSHPSQKRKSMEEVHHSSSHISTYTTHVAVQGQMELFHSVGSSSH